MDCHVSIIIPVYNVERYLRQCLDSCLAQTMREVQIICVDDGSTDGSPAILEEYANNDVRIQVVTRKNGGLSAARNTALPHVSGKYLIFVDSDDWIHEETCQRTFELAEKHNADLCVYRITRPGFHCGKTTWKQRPSDKDFRFFSNLTMEEKCREKLMTRDVSACCKLVRTDFLRAHGFTFPRGLCFEDMPFHWNVIAVAKKILYIRDDLYYYRQRSGSIMASRGKHHFDIIAIYDIIRHDLEQADCYKACRELFLNDKLAAFRRHYREISPLLRQEMRQRILESLTDDEWRHILDHPAMNRRHRKFYMELNHGAFSLQNYGWLAFADFWRTCEQHVFWPMKILWKV